MIPQIQDYEIDTNLEVNSNQKTAKQKPTLIELQCFKTKLCPYSFGGNKKCFRKEKCRYAHCFDELRLQPILTKTRLCSAYTKGHCLNANCSFAHGRHELRSTMGMYKTSLCKYWQKSICYAGQQCRHAHGEADLNTRQQIEAPRSTHLQQISSENAQLKTQSKRYNLQATLSDQDGFKSEKNHLQSMYREPLCRIASANDESNYFRELAERLPKACQVSKSLLHSSFPRMNSSEVYSEFIGKEPEKSEYFLQSWSQNKQVDNYQDVVNLSPLILPKEDQIQRSSSDHSESMISSLYSISMKHRNQESYNIMHHSLSLTSQSLRDDDPDEDILLKNSLDNINSDQFEETPVLSYLKTGPYLAQEEKSSSTVPSMSLNEHDFMERTNQMMSFLSEDDIHTAYLSRQATDVMNTFSKFRDFKSYNQQKSYMNPALDNFYSAPNRQISFSSIPDIFNISKESESECRRSNSNFSGNNNLISDLSNF